MADQTLDCKGLNCPMPIVRTAREVKTMASGETLEVVATDPGSVADFQAFCRTTGNELVESTQSGDTYRFLIKRVN